MQNHEISDLMERLEGDDIHAREQTRYLIVSAGTDAVPSLVDTLQNGNRNQRWEAAKLLGRIGDLSAASALVEALLDESMSVHWAASESLIELGSGAILPLLEGLRRHFDSARFRQGAYHILHMFEKMGYLEPHVQDVLNALREVESFATVPWAAERAIEALEIR